MSEELKNEIVIVTEKASSIIVSNENEYIAASEWLKANKKMQKRVADLLDPNIKNLHAAHRAATSQKKELLAPLVESSKTVSNVVGKYLAEKERVRLLIQKQEQEALQKEADEKAKLLNDLGFEAEAKIAKEEPIIAPAKIKKSVPKTGVSIRKDFDFEIVDATQIKGEFLIPDEQKIRRLVKTLGLSAQNIVGGIKVNEKIITSTRIK